jgi:catechol 2,3-dioxygenase-like lactoylglutathione lyase family enzyme
MSEPVIKVGPISHIGIVVEDAEKAAEFYSRVFGVGPFTTQVYDMSKGPYFLIDGKPSTAKFKASIAFSGDVFIELVEVMEGDTNHTQFLRKKGEGLQHLCFLVDDMKSAVTALKGEGLVPILDYEMETELNGERLQVHEVYLNSAEFVGGTTIQLLQSTPLES